MVWTVDWEPGVEDDLTDFWLKGPNRSEITRAQALIDEQLIDHFALKVVFEISEQKKFVKVTGIGIGTLE